jgi:hypothetical protein
MAHQQHSGNRLIARRSLWISQALIQALHSLCFSIQHIIIVGITAMEKSDVERTDEQSSVEERRESEGGV